MLCTFALCYFCLICARLFSSDFHCIIYVKWNTCIVKLKILCIYRQMAYKNCFEEEGSCHAPPSRGSISLSKPMAQPNNHPTLGLISLRPYSERARGSVA